MEAERSQRGFTMIELLVVILIVSILAAIAIPIFIKQRQKGWETAVRSTLRDAATVIETVGVEDRGSYERVAGANSLANNAAYQELTEEGFNKHQDVAITVATADDHTRYCITATHGSLDAIGNEWGVATFSSSTGRPDVSDTDTC